MRIVLAPDSYKGSLSAVEVTNAMERAILHVNKTAIVNKKPMADGGEGTVDAILKAKQGEQIDVNCTGPLGNKITTYYGLIDQHTAVIECANIAGLVQVPPEKRNPDLTTSFGLGEVIIAALDRGSTSLIIGLGGSAVNDGGLGMLQALGMKATDQAGNLIGIFGKDVHKVAAVDFSQLDERLKKVNIHVALDVDNPLCGKFGASSVYGPQKGATEKQVMNYDCSLNSYADLIETAVNKSLKNKAGSGAAGGLGFALFALGASASSGAKLVANTIELEAAIKQADLVITGEGQSDEQTLSGKAPSYVANLAKSLNVPTLLISGSVTGNREALRKVFLGCFSIVNQPLLLLESMERAEELLYEQTVQVIHFLSEMSNLGKNNDTYC